MIALEHKGPTNEEAWPIMLNREKKRNSFPRGVTSEICSYPSVRCDSLLWNLRFGGGFGLLIKAPVKTYHCLCITVPRRKRSPEPDLPHPKFPYVMETYCPSPESSHAIYVYGDQAECGCVKHYLSA